MNGYIKFDILKKSKGKPLYELFGFYQKYFGDIYKKPEIKEMFLKFMTQLVEEGELRFASSESYLKGTPQEQVDEFRRV